MQIHAISTGKVKITTKWRIGEGEGLGRLVNTLFDKNFTEWLPIYTWVIEHPEGLIVIDTGIPANANDPIYFPPFMPLIQRAAKFDIQPGQEIGPQMDRLGLSAADVRWVILTHLHQDHDGGMQYFPNAEFMISRKEWSVAQGFRGRMSGYLNDRWPQHLQPTLIDFDSHPLDSFPASFTLTAAGDVQLVPTPGHSAGHLSVILQDGSHSIFFAGDASYTEDMLIANQIDGVAPDPIAQQDTHRNIMLYAATHPTVYLPSHDPDAAQRLAQRQIIKQFQPA